MVYGKDYNKLLKKRRHTQASRSHQPWLLRGLSFIVSISVISAVLATTHQTLEEEKIGIAPALTVAPEVLERTINTANLPNTLSNPSSQIETTQPLISKESLEPEWETITINKGDTASSIFSRLKIHSQLQALLELPEAKKKLTRLLPGESFDYLIVSGELQAIRYDESETRHISFTKKDNKFAIDITEDDVETRIAIADGSIENSLFIAAKNAGVSDNLIMKLVDIFAYDIDYALDIRTGDQFKLIYEERYANGERLKDGRLLGAQFINQGKTHQAVKFTNSSGKSAYYAPDGRSLKKAFIRTPVKFSRISSHFDPKRMHPILHKIKAHRGVDYAAPTGTPIRATGEGKVIFVGNQRGYGKTVILQHGKRYSTLYAHLSGFRKGLRNGKQVKQGQVIGYVGKSGSATGPHLHYEFRINGKHKNPVTVKLPSAPPLPKADLAKFKKASEPLLAQLRSEQTIAQANIK